MVEECSLKQLFFSEFSKCWIMKRGEWKVDVNIGFWKCWAIFRADTKSISWSSRNEMICPFWWLAAAGINVHFEFWWSFSTITDYLWLKNWRERKTLPTLFSLGNLGSSEINFVAKCVNSLQLWSFDRKLNIERLHKDSSDLHFTPTTTHNEETPGFVD